MSREETACSGWYIVDAAVRVMMRPHTRMFARSEIEFLTNGHSAGYLTLTQHNIGGTSFLEWLDYDLFTGGTGGIAMGNWVTLHFRNYLQYAGVNPGRNTFTVVVHQYRGGVVRAAQLLRGSRIGHGSLSPAKMNLSIRLIRNRLRMGGFLPVKYEVRNSGFPARQTGMMIAISGPGLAVAGRPTAYWGWTVHRRGTVWLQALAIGKYYVHLLVNGATGTGELLPLEATVAVTVVH